MIVGSRDGTVRYYERLADGSLSEERLGAAGDPFQGIDLGGWSAPQAVDWDGDGVAWAEVRRPAIIVVTPTSQWFAGVVSIIRFGIL